MPGTNLTRDEARTRADLLGVESYTVDLDLTTDTKTFGSTTRIRFRCTAPGSSSFVDLVGATVSEITLNGRSLDPATVYREDRITLDDLAADNELRVVADCTYSHTGEGLHRFVDPADDRVYLYTQFETADSRRVYTSFEQPDLKARFTFNVTAPAHWKVVSNAPTPAPVHDNAGKAVWNFPTTERMSTYITALVAGEYHEVLDRYVGAHGEIPLGHYCRQSVKEHFDTDELLEVTKQGFEFFESRFGYPYPFHKYDQLYVPEYNMGAMENAGCVTFRDEYLPRSRQSRAFYEQRANTILHEMAHMWFGDLVTMRWWDDLWLNESFAEWAAIFAAVNATRYTEAWTGFTNSRKNWAYRQDQLPSTHPVAADNPDLEAVENNFDGITYAKGASALKQLVAWVGEDEFVAGLHTYFEKHAFANSEFTDLLAALEETSGRDLDAWADEWLRTSGVNTLTPVFEVGDDGTFTTFAVNQSATAEFPTLRRHRIGIGLYDRDERGRLVRRTTLETDVVGESTEVAGLVGTRQPDLLLLNDGDLTYAKIRLDERSLRTVLESIGTLEDSLARALCWSAAWDMTREAEMAASDFITLVLRGVGAETDMTAVGRMPAYAQVALEQFAHPDHRDELRKVWEDGVRGLIEAAEPGADQQLSFVRAFAGSTGKRIPPTPYSGAGRSPEAMRFMAGLLDGSMVLDGLTVDTDLRWLLLSALAAGGHADAARIDEELQRDHTIEGQERAAAARAVLPDPEAKAAAWYDAAENPEITNETQRSIAYVFDVAGQRELLAPYVEKYLDVAETMWEHRGVQIAQTTLEFMFPRACADELLLARVESWLQTTKANPAAKRLVEEGVADVRRALAAQAKDAD